MDIPGLNGGPFGTSAPFTPNATIDTPASPAPKRDGSYAFTPSPFGSATPSGGGFGGASGGGNTTAPSFGPAFTSTPTPNLFGGAGGFEVPSTGGGAGGYGRTPTPGSKRDAGSAFGAKEQDTSQKRVDITWKPRDSDIGGEQSVKDAPKPGTGENSFSSASAAPNGASPFGKVVREGDIRVPLGEAIKFGFDTVILTTNQGDKRLSSTIHKALFADRSGLFKKAPDSEPDRKELTVEGDGLGLALYVQFLYTGHLPIRSSSSTTESGTLCKLYTLATQLYNTVAKNAALDAIAIGPPALTKEKSSY